MTDKRANAVTLLRARVGRARSPAALSDTSGGSSAPGSPDANKGMDDVRDQPVRSSDQRHRSTPFAQRELAADPGRTSVRFVRQTRAGALATHKVVSSIDHDARDGARAAVYLRKKLARVPNRPARFPKSGCWPFEVRADMAAAALDYPSTKALCVAIARGEAPSASSIRGEGDKAEPVWSTEYIRAFVQSRYGS